MGSRKSEPEAADYADMKVSQKVNESVGQIHAVGARRSAAILGCEFQHCLGACRFRSHHLAAGRRLNSQAWTPELRVAIPGTGKAEGSGLIRVNPTKSFFTTAMLMP